MAAAQEAHESLRERARRALLDNPDPEMLAAVPGQPASAAVPAANPPEGAATAEQIDQRLKAIRLVRDLEPKRACYADRVRDLTRSLLQLPGDSVHYRTVLDKLREAHGEWQALEEKLWAAHYTIRSTQWLVDLLSDPAADLKEVPGDHEGQ